MRKFALSCSILFLVGKVAFGSVVISEVMANPADEDTGEFIELFNLSETSIDLLGWTFTDGDATDEIQPFNGGIAILPPQNYALLLDREYAENYDIPTSTILLTTQNTTLGNGLQLDDQIQLFDRDKNLIDTFTPPFKAKNDRSIEKIELDFGNFPENWQLSKNILGSSPGRKNSTPNGATTEKFNMFLSEIMPSPNSKLDQTEWIELFNPNPQDIELSDWQIEDESGKSGAIPFGTTIFANGFLILADAHQKFVKQFPNVINVVELKLPSLNNDGDTINLVDRFNRQIDTMTYESSKIGRSIERKNFDSFSNSPENWSFSIDLSGATPGRINSRNQQISEGKVELEISPSLFNPKVQETHITYEAPVEAKIQIRIFNSAGKIVKTLIDGREVGGRQSIFWNGANGNGNLLPIGLYICQLVAEISSEKPAIRLVKTIVIAH